MASRSNILYVYKNLLKMAKGLPETKREQSLRTIKEDFRKNMGELDPLLVNEMLIKANSTLGSCFHNIPMIHSKCLNRIVKDTTERQ
jgi:Complex 1 protein (LYR family)